MNVKYLGFGCAAACLLAVPAAAIADQPGVAPGLMAQNTYSGGTVFSQDSILQQTPPLSGRAQVEAAETNVHLAAAFMHTQYHENAEPGAGDDENGFTAGFNVGASALLPDGALPFDTDLYTSLSYEFSAGNLAYGGHYLVSGKPATATDNAVFNRIEARIGVGFPLVHGAEVIPFIAVGYQAWNRNVGSKGTLATNEFYHTGLFGGGVRLDVPVTPRLVVSATGEMLALMAGGIDEDNFNLNHNLGTSAEERVELGLNYNVAGRFSVTSMLYWEHFNDAGFKPTPSTYYLYEPLSTTTQFGASIGVAYSFL